VSKHEVASAMGHMPCMVHIVPLTGSVSTCGPSPAVLSHVAGTWP
jgi:hypothetical protein